MTAAMISPGNAPRDLGELIKLSRAIRFRLALNLNIVTTGTDEATAFVNGTPEVQARTVLEALHAWDSGNGSAPQQQQLPAPMQPVGQVAPQMMPPPMAANMPPQMGGQMSAPPAMQAAPTSRTPATTTDPGNAGATPAAAGNNTAVLKAVAELKTELKAIKGELETCAGAGDLEEHGEVLKGLTRVVRMILVLQLELAESQLGMDKATIMSMISAMSSGDELDLLLKGVEGKG